MMPARVFAVGRSLPGDAAEYVPFRSDRSLFDADLVVFTPTFADYRSFDRHAGKPLVSEADSPDLIRDCTHWRTEIKATVESGKTVFAYLPKPEDVYYDTGRRTYSGTGRSRVTTRQVDSASSYDALPLELEGLVPKGGSDIAVLGELGPLAVYWHEFGSMSEYEVYFDRTGLQPLLGTKKGEKTVAAVLPAKGGGSLVVLPPLKWDEDALTYTRGESTYWRKEAVRLGNRLLTALISASEAFRNERTRTPPPDWASDETYSLPVQASLQAEAARLESQIEALEAHRSSLRTQIAEAGELRGLLFESGKPLEGAIIRALRLLGFAAQPYRDDQSEFDAVFSSPEGRFLGEAEGRDTKSINIDKMSQLERNLQEDFARESVTSFAKGVLFGNAFRLLPPAERGAFFTDKCITAALRLDVALVRTPDLFEPARYLSTTVDDAFAEQCRRAIFNAHGTVVVFPAPTRTQGHKGTSPDEVNPGSAQPLAAPHRTRDLREQTRPRRRDTLKVTWPGRSARNR